MLQDITTCFGCIRKPSSPDFTATAAASCLLDSSVASVLVTEDTRCLLDAAKEFIISEAFTYIFIFTSVFSAAALQINLFESLKI
jgi:hypothetical protein